MQNIWSEKLHDKMEEREVLLFIKYTFLAPDGRAA
jgi:hypothetical protein